MDTSESLDVWWTVMLGIYDRFSQYLILPSPLSNLCYCIQEGGYVKNLDKVKKIVFSVFMRRILFVIFVILIWELIYQLKIFPELLFPSVKDVFSSLITGIKHGALLTKTAKSLSIIFYGMFVGLSIALLLMALSLKNKIFKNITDNLIVYLNPIPSMAVFPLCILWFGIGRNALIFVMIHSVLWGLLVNLMTGVASIPPKQKEIGQNMELSKLRMLTDIYIPACMPYIVAGAKQSLARAWRTAISVEMIAGVVANNQGLGWLMTKQRNLIDLPGLYSTVIVIIIVGIFLEDVAFKVIENVTVRKWGMMK